MAYTKAYLKSRLMISNGGDGGRGTAAAGELDAAAAEDELAG
jgi:hypothetical protein